MAAAAPIYSFSPIVFAECRQFRVRCALDPGLIEDSWDSTSEHLGFFCENILIATLRVVHALDSQLPISAFTSVLPVSVNDIQVGRLVIDRTFYCRSSIRYVYTVALTTVFLTESRVYVAASPHGPLSPARYGRLGFVDTGYEYTDDRYRSMFKIFLRDNRIA